MLMRSSYTERINEMARKIHRDISGGREELFLRYSPSVKMGNDIGEIRENYYKKLDSPNFLHCLE